MSTLASTTWRFDVAGSGHVVWTFHEDGTASAGGRAIARWVEDQNRNFIIELTGQHPGQYNTAWAGRHTDGTGQGVASPLYNGASFSFTMKKQQGAISLREGMDPALIETMN